MVPNPNPESINPKPKNNGSWVVDVDEPVGEPWGSSLHIVSAVEGVKMKR